MDLTIRTATPSDRDAVRDVCLSAFPEEENHTVARLAEQLLDEDTSPATFTFVAEDAGRVEAQIGFSPVWSENDGRWLGYVLAPLGVAASHQRSGMGSALIRRGIERLTGSGTPVLLVYGDPDYYSRFGFCGDAAEYYVPPYKLQYPHGWQALVLGDARALQQPERVAVVGSLRDPALW